MEAKDRPDGMFCHMAAMDLAKMLNNMDGTFTTETAVVAAAIVAPGEEISDGAPTIVASMAVLLLAYLSTFLF